MKTFIIRRIAETLTFFQSSRLRLSQSRNSEYFSVCRDVLFLNTLALLRVLWGDVPIAFFNRKIITIRKAAVANFATAASFWLIILIYRKLSLYGSSVNCSYYSFPASFLYLSSLSVFSSSASTKSFSASSGCAFFKVA